jgi:hypothetical protein
MVLMQTFGLTLAILAVVGMFIAFIPLLGWFNWLNIPFAIIGLILNAAFLMMADKTDRMAIVALVLCVVVIFFGIFRLILGGGVL